MGTAVAIYFKSWVCGIASFLGGIFLDLDHLFDCYINYGPFFKLEDLYIYCTEIRFRRLTLLFHSYELVAILWIFIFLFSLGSIWKAVAIGVTQHLILDQLANIGCYKMDNRSYFLAFRLKNGFRRDRMVTEL